jgi:hypothetical protein
MMSWPRWSTLRPRGRDEAHADEHRGATCNGRDKAARGENEPDDDLNASGAWWPPSPTASSIFELSLNSERPRFDLLDSERARGC